MHKEAAKVKWYESWFGSPWYPILYCDRNEKEAAFFIDHLISKLHLLPGISILDLACGRGRHAICLSQKGFHVTGVDLSEENIHAAKKNENDRLTFFVHDMRLPFRINYFDLVLNLFTSFGYFENDRENQKTIQAIASGLKPGGRLILDYINSFNAGKELIEYEEKECRDAQFLIRRFIHGGYIVKEITVKSKSGETKYVEKVKILGVEDFKNYFAASGLKILHLYGSYSLEEYRPESSERIILVAEKSLS